MYEEFEPPIDPDDHRYVSPGGDCPAVSKYACTLGAGHAGPHVAHGTEFVDGKSVDLMYARWDDQEEGRRGVGP
jgi:hypothetical protein